MAFCWFPTILSSHRRFLEVNPSFTIICAAYLCGYFSVLLVVTEFQFSSIPDVKF